MARILVAEDDDSMRQFLSSALRRAGHDVASFADGNEAMTAIADDIPAGYDLLLADIVMPGMDGVELARRAVAESPHIKVMFITGFAAVAVNARNSFGRDAKVLSKPFHLRELVDHVHAMLDA